MNKPLIRLKIRRAVEKLKPAAREAKSRKIMARLLRHPYFKRAKNVLAYAALDDEVRTREFIEKTIRLRKKVFMPRVNKKKRELEFYEIRNWDTDLVPGRYGILEPIVRGRRKTNGARFDLAVVPGRAFDRRGGRLGRGGGFYDRFLKRHPGLKKVGIAFREQIVGRIPAEAHDAAVDELITA